jgi:hypothetical protein
MAEKCILVPIAICALKSRKISYLTAMPIMQVIRGRADYETRHDSSKPTGRRAEVDRGDVYEALHPELQTCGKDRIREVAERIELEAHQSNMSVETAVELAVEWCEDQNGEARLHVTI